MSCIARGLAACPLEATQTPNISMPEPSLKGRALRLLSTREYSRIELERKLIDHESTPGLLARALDELQAKGFISEQRVVESVIHRKSAKLGTARIQRELQNKGLDAGVVQVAVARLQSTELDRAHAVWRKKFGASLPATGSTHAASASERAKQMRFMASRGFSGDTIRRVVAGASDDQDVMPD